MMENQFDEVIRVQKRMEEVEESNNRVEEPLITNRFFLNPAFLYYLFFKINGRISRLDFWLGYFLAGCLPIIVNLAYISIVSNANETFVAGLNVLLLGLYWLMCINLNIKRFHDLDLPGSTHWWFLFPIFNSMTFMVLFFMRGTPEKNLYGAPPSNTYTASTTGSSRILAEDVSA